MRSRPVIGVPADRRIVAPHPYHMVGEKFLKALVECSGALPLIVPVMAEELDVDLIMSHIDGVMLTGSISNIEPHHYEGGPSADDSKHDPARDALTLPLARRAMETDMPLLAVCRGFQELNVALGGSLHQRVHEVDGYHDHRENPDDPLEIQYGPAHTVSLTEGGLLHRMHGSTHATVNSLHWQGVDRLADGVTVEARADDGLIEAFHVDRDEFALAVQWHPEWKTKENEFSTEIYRAFGDACRRYMSRKAT